MVSGVIRWLFSYIKRKYIYLQAETNNFWQSSGHKEADFHTYGWLEVTAQLSRVSVGLQVHKQEFLPDYCCGVEAVWVL